MTNLTHSFSSIKMYENCPLRYYHQRIIKSVQDKGSDATLYGERIHKALEDRLRDGTELSDEAKHFEGLAKKVEQSTKGAKLHLEMEMTLNADLEPTGWWDADAWLRSKIDVLVLYKDKAHVLDWKTGKRRVDFMQLELFALQVFKHFPEINTVNSTFIWLKEKSIDSEQFTRDQAPDMWRTLLDKIRRIELSLEKDKWPARPSGLCRFCPARHLCDYAN